ncbi:hypothetical protein P9A16_34380 [Shinella sp. 838]|uniref:hypothetical protein n=1 Tax=Shinella sp. 838 TaxID=3038164 RepID=UPI002414D7B9|nr:hypothetical protein [Shinella sp. 838]MDG4676173.1 hypothetical protein [Shinella sp. 838]
MAFAIGLRFYRIAVRRKGEKDPLEIGPGSEPCDFIDYVSDFVDRRNNPTSETDAQRTWFFEPVATQSIRTVHGYISYGTHGFESQLKDVKTKKSKYNRLSTDLEEIPLYFQFWVPSNAEYALVAFQSFQGRSCVSFIQSAMVLDFQQRYPDYSISFRVMAPASAISDVAPVKAVTFVKPRRYGDPADRPWKGKTMDEVEYELTVRSKRRGGMLSTFKDLEKMFPPNPDGVVVFDGVEYEGAKADVKIGNKRRTIGVFGAGGDAGLIDITDTVKTARNGHPSFDSIAAEVDSLMETFFDGIKT